MQTAIALAALVLLAYALRWAVRLVLLRAVPRFRRGLPAGWLQALLGDAVLTRLSQLVPSLVIQAGIFAVPHLHPVATTVVRNVAVAVTVLQAARVLTALLDALEHYNQASIAAARDTGAPTRSIKSYVQLGKLVILLVAGVVVVATLIDRSPLILLSGLGAMSAVLMLVFKDTILSFTAGVQLAGNDMLRVGDWLQMDQVGADGAVVDMALNTVKIRNWDNTITTIPTWRLMSESFRNWRGMSESGGRRIKRALNLDAGTARFLTPAEIDALGQIALLRPYLTQVRADIAAYNADFARQSPDMAHEIVNLRALTNIGTFRAYVNAYLRAHPRLRQDMTLMARMLQPTENGMPIEIYAFTATTAWVEYEAIQADLFDHLVAILPEFGLRAFQNPSGSDLALALRLGSVPQ
ncbi:MAG: mechanosensitive ion channel family protein [Comamonas sp.]